MGEGMKRVGLTLTLLKYGGLSEGAEGENGKGYDGGETHLCKSGWKWVRYGALVCVDELER